MGLSPSIYGIFYFHFLFLVGPFSLPLPHFSVTADVTTTADLCRAVLGMFLAATRDFNTFYVLVNIALEVGWTSARINNCTHAMLIKN